MVLDTDLIMFGHNCRRTNKGWTKVNVHDKAIFYADASMRISFQLISYEKMMIGLC